MEVLTETMGALAEKGQEGTFVIISACNDWNCDQRWPKAYLNAVKFGRQDFGWVETSVDIPVGAGMHRRLVEEVVDEAVGATLRFFRFLNEKLDWSTVVATP